jgi:hypothetical protein
MVLMAYVDYLKASLASVAAKLALNLPEADRRALEEQRDVLLKDIEEAESCGTPPK